MVAFTLQELIDNGNNKYLINKYIRSDGIQDIIEASAQNDISLIKLLLDHGVDISVCGYSCLSQAITYDKVDVVKFLLEKGANPTVYANQLICSAIEINNIEIIKLLVQYGADVNATRSYCSILHLAVVGNKKQAVEFLVKSGAKITDQMIKSAKGDIKEFLTGHKNILCVGIESNVKLNIKLPDLLEINKDKKYYYVYKFDSDGTAYTLTDEDNKKKTLSELGICKYFNNL